MTLKFAPKLDLPDDILTEAIAIVANRGAGKTYTSKKLVELMTQEGLPTCILDPLGVWWGLRSSANGKSAGLPFVVVGGNHGDVPLEPTAGKVVADFVLRERVPTIIDMSGLRKAEQRRFVLAFLEEIYERSRNPLHVVVDECDLFCPQRPSKDFPPSLLGVMEDVVRRGRSKGLGITLISQRPAVIHKDVLSQVSVLMSLRLVSPQDRAAIASWIETHGTVEERKKVLDALPSLGTGEGYFYSPYFMQTLTKFKAYRAETFDSSATPKLGEKAIEPSTFAEVDLDALTKQMSETIERAKENDPKLLKAEVAKLKAKVSNLELEASQIKPTEVVVHEVEPIHDPRVRDLVNGLYEAASDLLESVGEILKVYAEDPQFERTELTSAPAISVAPPLKLVDVLADDDPTSLTKVEREIMTVLAQFPDGRTMSQLALLSGRSSKSSSFKNALSSLRTSGALLGSNRDTMKATGSGLERLGGWYPLPEGRGLVDHWMRNLGKPERAILDVLIEHWPHGMGMDDLSVRSGYSISSSGFKNALSKLRTLGLLVGSNQGEMTASDIFFAKGDWRHG